MTAFLKLIPPPEAKKILLGAIPLHSIERESIDITKASGRVTASSVYSSEMLPAFTRSTVDGYAVIATNTHGASESLPAYLTQITEVLMGTKPGFTIHEGETALIHTGGMIPDGADSVVMLEYCQNTGNDLIEVTRSVASGENLIIAGEDVKPGREVIPAGKVLRPADIGGLAALGILNVEVARKPVVGIISSGDEVITPDKTPLPGQVRDINTITLSLLVEENGGIARQYGIVADNPGSLQACAEKALMDCDMLLITAGSSTSHRDLTSSIIQNLGQPGVLVHGVNLRPGKPTILAVCDQKPVIGLPGNPVSALVVAGLFVKPVLRQLLGIQKELPQPTIAARLTANVPSNAGREDWVPIILNQTDEGLLAEPIFFKSNLIFNMASADGLIRVPPDATGVPAGEMVEVIIG